MFGIINADKGNPEEVILSFDAHQGKYIKSLPIHVTQHILIDTEAELRIKVTLFITHNFVMELLSYGETVTIIQLQVLIEALKESYQNALDRY